MSGIHGTGLGDMLDELTTKHMKKVVNVMKENATNIALIGRPNVGKSSLFNRLGLAHISCPSMIHTYITYHIYILSLIHTYIHAYIQT